MLDWRKKTSIGHGWLLSLIVSSNIEWKLPLTRRERGRERGGDRWAKRTTRNYLEGMMADDDDDDTNDEMERRKKGVDEITTTTAKRRRLVGHIHRHPRHRSFSLASFLLFRRWFALLAATNLSLSPSTWTNLSKVFYLSDRLICCDYWFLLWMRRKREREWESVWGEKSRFFRSSALFFSLYISDSLLRLSDFRSGQSTQWKSKRERNSRNPSCIDRCLYLLHCFISRNWRRKRFLSSLLFSPLSLSNVECYV